MLGRSGRLGSYARPRRNAEGAHDALHRDPVRDRWACRNHHDGPEKRNALNHALLDDLLHALNVVADDDALKVAILRANGPAFSAGYDIDGSPYINPPDPEFVRPPHHGAYVCNHHEVDCGPRSATRSTTPLLDDLLHALKRRRR